MKTIQSKISENLKWKINTSELSEDEITFIEQFNPCIYHNDLTCKLWSFDEKLPTGRWLENITFNNELTLVKALIL